MPLMHEIDLATSKALLSQCQKDFGKQAKRIAELEDENAKVRADNDVLRSAYSYTCSCRMTYDEEVIAECGYHAEKSAENARLRDAQLRLSAFEAAGVDNWQGFDEAMSISQER